MFAKLATFRTFNRAVARRFAAAAAPCNDNQPVTGFVAAPRLLRRPILLCRWHKAASGGLECSWHRAAIAASDVDEPEIRRLMGRIPAVKPERCALYRFLFQPAGPVIELARRDTRQCAHLHKPQACRAARGEVF